MIRWGRMLTDLPPSVLRFRQAAARHGLEPEIVLHATPARTAEEAAAACLCDLGQIVKSLVFRGLETGLPLLFLISGRNRLDMALAADAAGETIVRPDAAFVRAATGYAIGGIPPLGHDRPARTFMDRTLFAYETVWAAAGHPNAVFPVATERLRAAAGAIVADLAEAENPTDP